MSKAIAIGYLVKVSAGNVNASHTEGNVVVAKKVTLPDGSTRPYISGQALRRMLRDRLDELGYRLSEPSAQLINKQEVTPPVRPWDFIDEDLFGYLDPSGARRRTSPVRVSPVIGLFPFQGDRDLGTRSFERFGQTMAAGGNMFETELYANLFKGNILIELDRVGVFREIETGQQDQTLDINERKKRVSTLLEALNLLWGGGRTARMLVDLSPKFFAYARVSVKHPVFLEALTANYEDGGFWLVLGPLKNVLEKFASYRQHTVFGLEPGVFANEEEIRAELAGYGHVLVVHEAIAEAKADIEKSWNGSSS